MPVAACKAGTPRRSYVTVRYRLRGKKAIYRYLNELAGANRYLWNAALAHIKEDFTETGKSNTSYVSFCGWYKQHKETSAPWLSAYPAAATRTGLKDLADAFTQFFKKVRRFPKFKKKAKTKKSFQIDVSGGSRFTEQGYFRLKRGLFVKMMGRERVHRYVNPIAKSARIVEEHGHWYMAVQYKVDALEYDADETGVGVDRNVGQIAVNAGQMYLLTDVLKRFSRIVQLQRRLAKQKKRSNRWKKTKKMIARHERKIARIRKNDLRHIAKLITSISTLVFLEDLKTKGMTKSAKGTIEEPGKHVKQKAGLNREILRTAWATLERFLKERGYVYKVNPAYTSQTCSACGNRAKENRKSQSEYSCSECGFELNADINAAMNIWASGMASMNGRGAYVRPVLVRQDRQQVTKRQNEHEGLRHQCT